MTQSVAVIGAGPAGLVVSAELMRSGAEVVCLETSGTPGGMLRTFRRDGFLAEAGPHTLRIQGGPVTDILDHAGLSERLIDSAPAAKKRFLTLGGKPVATPASPLGLITSPLLSAGAKLRLLREPFVRRAPSDADETVAEFVRRRLGDETLTRLVDAFVGGIHAGNPERLSLRHAFPSLHRFERDSGSVIRGAIASAKASRAKGPARITSFAEGMAALPEAFASRLGPALKTNVVITRLEKTAGGWDVAWRDKTTGEETSRRVDAVVITAPAWRWPTLPLPVGLDRTVSLASRIPHPPVAVVTLGYAREKVAHPLDGFGVLTPAVENRKALGVLFPSSLFPNRAPDGAVTLATFVGGSRQPELGALNERELAALAREECGSLLGASGEPVFVHVARWSHAIPQYAPGHGEFVKALDNAETELPGLYFCGNYRGGVAVTAAMENAAEVARRILRSKKAE